jgi:hypothetical protein
MHKVSARLTLLVAVLASGVAAALFLRDLDRQASDLTTIEQQLAQRVDRLGDAIVGIGVAQQAYLAAGQRDQQSFERMTSLVRQIYDDTAALKPILRSADRESGIQALNAATGNLVTADARARENLRIGQEAMAADVIFSDGRSTLDAMNQRVRAIRGAEQAFYQAERARLSQQRYIVLGVAALGWIAALIVLVPSRRSHALAEVPTASPEPWQEHPVVADRPLTPSLDLAAAADLCTALSRLTTTTALPSLFAQAADLLDAPGIILWMGAGEELFAVTAHGYRPEIIARLGPIAHGADNATAAAWRTGQPTIVAGDAAGNGAVVTPMFGPAACIGALAVELRHGREQDPATRAVVSMIAAQLATVVSAWPAASTAPELRSASGQ